MADVVKSISEAILGSKPQPYKAWLAGYNAAKDEWSKARPFQFYPESVSDSRSVNFQEKYGIGSSHPLYQWISGSSREIAFDAVFVSDDEKLGTSSPTAALDEYKKWVKNPALAAYGAISKSKASSYDQYSIEISDALAWLRSFTYPVYDGNGRVSAPQTCMLWFEGSRIASFASSGHDLGVIPCLMTRCDVTYESFFNTGKPRVVTVSLTFVETIQVGRNWQYVNGQRLIDMGAAYSPRTIDPSAETQRDLPKKPF